MFHSPTSAAIHAAARSVPGVATVRIRRRADARLTIIVGTHDDSDATVKAACADVVEAVRPWVPLGVLYDVRAKLGHHISKDFAERFRTVRAIIEAPRQHNVHGPGAPILQHAWSVAKAQREAAERADAERRRIEWDAAFKAAGGLAQWTFGERGSDDGWGTGFRFAPGTTKDDAIALLGEHGWHVEASEVGCGADCTGRPFTRGAYSWDTPKGRIVTIRWMLDI